MSGKQNTLGTAIVYISADIKGLNKNLGDAHKLFKQNLGHISEMVKGIGEKMALAGAAISAAMGIAIHKVEELGSSVEILSKKTGASVEMLSGLKYAAEKSGTSLDAVGIAFKRLQKAIIGGDAEDEKASEKSSKRRTDLAEQIQTIGEKIRRSKRDYAELFTDPLGKDPKAGRERMESIQDKAQEIRGMFREIADLQSEINDQADENPSVGLKMLGLDPTQLKNMDPSEMFLKVARAVGEVKNKTEQVAIALKLWGKSGTDLLPMLEDMDAALERAKELGIVITKDQAENAHKFGVAILDLRSSIQGFMNQAILPILPKLKKFLDNVTDIVVHVRNWANAHPRLTGNLTETFIALGPLLISLTAFAAVLLKIYTTLKMISVLSALRGAAGVAVAAGGAVGAGAAGAGGAAAAAGGGMLAAAVGGSVAAIAATVAAVIGTAGVGFVIGEIINKHLPQMKEFNSKERGLGPGSTSKGTYEEILAQTKKMQAAGPPADVLKQQAEANKQVASNYAIEAEAKRRGLGPAAIAHLLGLDDVYGKQAASGPASAPAQSSTGARQTDSVTKAIVAGFLAATRELGPPEALRIVNMAAVGYANQTGGV